MTDFFLNTDAATMSPVALFLQADIVVKIVMAGLLFASIWTWAIIVSFWFRIGKTRRGIERFERDFWKAEDIDAFYHVESQNDLPVARVFSAGVREWRRSTAAGIVDRDGTRERLATAIGLFAAIPAVIAYNRFSHGTNKIEARLNRFADGFYATLSRQLETDLKKS